MQPNLPSWVQPIAQPLSKPQRLQNLAQAYTQPMRPKTGGWDGQGPNPNAHPVQQQTGLQGLGSHIPPELMQFFQPFMNMVQQGQSGAMNGMKGLLGFQPIDHDPFKQTGQQSGGGLYGG